MQKNGVFRPDLNIRQYATIFDQPNPGVAHIREALTQQHLSLLRTEVLSLHGNGMMEDVPETYGVARQRFSKIYMGSADNGNSTALENSQPLRKLAEAYTNEVYNELAIISGFSTVAAMNSIGVHRYPAVGGLLTYHMDEARYTNLISVFSIDGKTKFSIARSLKGDSQVSRIIEPGDLVLMRTMRSREEIRTHRVYHMVESVGEDRYSIIFRNDSELFGPRQ